MLLRVLAQGEESAPAQAPSSLSKLAVRTFRKLRWTHLVAPALGGSPRTASRGSRGRAEPGLLGTDTGRLTSRSRCLMKIPVQTCTRSQAGRRAGPSSRGRGAGTGVPRVLRIWSPRRRTERCGKTSYSEGLKSREAHTENERSHCVPVADVARQLLCEPLLSKAFQDFLDGLGTFLSSKCLVLTAKPVFAVVGLGFWESAKSGIAAPRCPPPAGSCPQRDG